MVHDFDTIPISDEKKPRVGIVGEILVKFLPAANNHLADLLEAEGAEPVVPDLIDFICYCFYNQNFKVEKLGFKKSKATIANLGLRAIDWLRKQQMKPWSRAATLHRPQISVILQKWLRPSFLPEIRPVKDGF